MNVDATEQAHSRRRAATSGHSSGYFRVPNRLLDDDRLRGLRAISLRVLLAMMRLADRRGVCWPTQAWLAGHCGVSERAVHDACRQLIDARLIVRERIGRPGRASEYRLLIHPAGGPSSPGHQATAAEAGFRNDRSSNGGTTARRNRNDASASGGTPVPPTHTHDSNPSHTQTRDVCAMEAAGGEAITTSGTAADPSRDAGDAGTSRVGRLQALGVGDQTALDLLVAHTPDQIDCALDNAAFLATHQRLANPAGYVVDALRRNYGPIPERLEEQRRLRRRRGQRELEQRQAARQRADSERTQRELNQQADDALAFVRGMDDRARAAAIEGVLAGIKGAVRRTYAALDPRQSRNFARMVRAHVMNGSPQPATGDGRDPPAG